MATILGAAAIDFIKTVVEKVIPDPAAKATALLEIERLHQSGELAQLQADTDLSKGQMEINKIEAANTNLFVSGWRPAAGWICVFGLAYQMVIRNLLGWLAENLFHWTLPPDLDIQTLMTLLFGLLGLSTMRSVDKYNKVASK